MLIRISISALNLPKSREFRMFIRFLAKNRICLFFVYNVSDCKYFQNFEGANTL